MLGWLVNSAGSAMINHNFMVEEFAYRPEINTTEVPANDSTQAVFGFCR